MFISGDNLCYQPGSSVGNALLVSKNLNANILCFVLSSIMALCNSMKTGYAEDLRLLVMLKKGIQRVKDSTPNHAVDFPKDV